MSTPPAHIPGVGDLRSVSRIQVAHEQLGRCVERIEEMNIQLNSAFEALWKAQAQMKEVGVSADTVFGFPIQEAWSLWKAKQHNRDHDEGSKR